MWAVYLFGSMAVAYFGSKLLIIIFAWRFSGSAKLPLYNFLTHTSERANTWQTLVELFKHVVLI